MTDDLALTRREVLAAGLVLPLAGWGLAREAVAAPAVPAPRAPVVDAYAFDELPLGGLAGECSGEWC